ncbi:reverse transcriptase domain-containing protein [Thalassospira alkalitolerans]|uniref:reverse transcriptase domain-containing protein n=1 Tax=Thalassospira alkalitolerans TaxID=1293890 RepID=UPI003AA8AD50
MVGLKDIGLAYRKAKVDLYYSSHPSMKSIVEYEGELHQNLSDLLLRINGLDETWVTQPTFLGAWTLAAKSVEMPLEEKGQKNNGNGLIFSSPAEKWDNDCSTLNAQKVAEKPNAVFRVMADCSLDFHVLSALWMMEVGCLFDAKLSSSAYGNRLRRRQKDKAFSKLSLGSFSPYLTPFRNWRDKGIEAMRGALDMGKKVIAVTADVNSFYHELNPGFLESGAFLNEVLGVTLTNEQKKLNRLFITGLEAWAKNTPLGRGIPVGLPASGVIANLALVELDRIIEQQVMPVYYGRYVDDILLIMENGAGFQSKTELWEWLFSRSSGKLGWDKNSEDNNNEIIYQTDYLNACDSKIKFSNDKNKVFSIYGEAGKDLVNSIACHIYKRASEWRAMPHLPHSPEQVGTDLLSATQSDGEAADNLRKADTLTMLRSSFAIKLRDLEAHERDLSPDVWQEHRRAFFRAFTQHVLVLPSFFDLASYLPRIVRLAVACEDFSDLRKIVGSLYFLCDQIKTQCNLSVKSLNVSSIDSDEIFTRWSEKIFQILYESIVSAFPPRLSEKGREDWLIYMAKYSSGFDYISKISWPISAKVFQSEQVRYFSFDLAHTPFRFIGLPAEMVSRRGVPAKNKIVNCTNAEELLNNEHVINGVRKLASWTGIKGVPNGLLFATRPYNLPELFILHREAYSKSGQDDLRKVVLSVRGFRLNNKIPYIDKNGVLQVPDGEKPSKFGVAVCSWKTNINSWVAAAMCAPDPDISRYARLNRLLDSVISQPQHSRYLVLPELALPAHWFIRVARKLQGRGISLISGVEYLHARKSRVHNQVWASLSHDGFGFPSIMIYRQDKQLPALHEEVELRNLAGLKMQPAKKWKTPPIIKHGDFRFAMLVCSELTNISYRAALRGGVDAIFVPEWNQDTETFNALVESAALDVHAYIVQCNDRQYGDSRIRAPFKDSWMRDLLRVKGGVTDYCVIGKIDVKALRRFQSHHRSPSNPFKPVPDGFEITHDRKILPTIEGE